VFTVKGGSAVWHEVLDFLPGVANSAVYAVVYGSLSLLVASLASRRAVAAAVIVAVFVVTTPVVGALHVIGGQTARQLSFLASPTTIVQGASTWLFRTDDIGVGPFGPLYAGAVAALAVICVAATLLRYRTVAR
jgi:ABC-2 type transport system permease protein